MSTWLGRDLGTRTVSYGDRDPILYALALGVSPSRLDLIFEDQLRVLPTFGLTLAQWAPDALGSAGAFDTSTAVHGAQALRVLAPLAPLGRGHHDRSRQQRSGTRVRPRSSTSR